MFGVSPLEIVILGLLLLVLAGVAVAVITAAASRRRPLASNPNLRPCPDCSRLVSLRAPSCPHCGRPLDPLQ